MKNKSFKEIALPAIMLFIIALVCTALLAGTNMLTKDRIADLAVQTALEAKAAVMSDAASFSEEKTITFEVKTLFTTMPLTEAVLSSAMFSTQSPRVMAVT